MVVGNKDMFQTVSLNPQCYQLTVGRAATINHEVSAVTLEKQGAIILSW
jgi:hypothetical protein